MMRSPFVQLIARVLHCSGWRSLVIPAGVALIALPGSQGLAATNQNARSAIGINLQGLSYYSSELPLINIFPSGSGWITHADTTWDTGEEKYLNLDSDGWPKTLIAIGGSGTQAFTTVGTLLMRLNSTANGYYPAGRYVVLYDGQGTLSYGFDANLVSHSPGRDVIDVPTPSGAGIDLRITETDPGHTGNYVRNIRVIKAENELAQSQGRLFNATFLGLLSNFRALRFMDWLGTNASPLSSWANRPLPSNAFWTTASGVPLELAVDLANAISADAWLNVPHMADDDYIGQMAALVHARLGRSQKVYIEFSNEVWNPGFSQFQYAVNQAVALWGAQKGGYDGNRSWYGMRVAQMCDIWKSAWAADSGRVVCVLAAQAASIYSATAALKCPFWSTGTPCSRHGISAIAIAPYFGHQGVPPAWTSLPDGGLSLLFQSLYEQNDPRIPGRGHLSQACSWEAAYAVVASAYKLSLIAYEGGQEFANGATPELNDLYVAANRDPRMMAAYSHYLRQWKGNGGELFMHYNDIGAPGKYGSWGALESAMQSVSPQTSAPPKWQAIQDFIATNPCWWEGCDGKVAPASLPSRAALPIPRIP